MPVDTTRETTLLTEPACTINLGIEVITIVTCPVCGHIGCDKTAKPEGRHYGYLDLPPAKVGLGPPIKGEGELILKGALVDPVKYIPISLHNDTVVPKERPVKPGYETVGATTEFAVGNTNTAKLTDGPP